MAGWAHLTGEERAPEEEVWQSSWSRLQHCFEWEYELALILAKTGWNTGRISWETRARGRPWPGPFAAAFLL